MRARADGRAVANHISDPLGVGNGDALAPKDAKRLHCPVLAAVEKSSSVSLKRWFVDATTEHAAHATTLPAVG